MARQHPALEAINRKALAEAIGLAMEELIHGRSHGISVLSESDPFDCGMTISAGLRKNPNPYSQAWKCQPKIDHLC